MPLPPPRSKDGLPSIRDLARKMCVLVNTFGPNIEKFWGDDELVMAALLWARTACTIVPNLDEALNSEVPADPSGGTPPDEWPGIDPSAPPPDLDPE